MLQVQRARPILFLTVIAAHGFLGTTVTKGGKQSFAANALCQRSIFQMLTFKGATGKAISAE